IAKQCASEPWLGRVFVWIEPALLGSAWVEKPASSRRHKAWRDNDRSPDSCHVHSRYCWVAAGGVVEPLDLTRETVSFRT
ncbi:MAG: hypothetical protein KY456_12065, partial [Chloroflexi bacterium]|nr:hypothetical protein [Chloroflexota bacterium]